MVHIEQTGRMGFPTWIGTRILLTKAPTMPKMMATTGRRRYIIRSLDWATHKV